MRPFFPYYGSKWNIARHYPPPVHRRVIEPFAGSAGYSLFYDCADVTLIDADPIVAGVWEFLIQVKPNEIASLPDMPEVGDSVDNYPLPQEAKWLIGFWLNRGSSTPKKTRTAYSARADRSQLNWGARAKARIVAQLPGISGWRALRGDYSGSPSGPATIFVDPPYGDKGIHYRCRLADLDALGRWCRGRASDQVIACEGKGADWLPFSPLGTFKTSKGAADEVVWVNNGAKDSYSTKYASAEEVQGEVAAWLDREVTDALLPSEEVGRG